MNAKTPGRMPGVLSVLTKLNAPIIYNSRPPAVFRKFHHALIKRPRAELGVLSVLVQAGSLVRCLAQIESVVHADQDSGRGRFGTEGTTSRTGNEVRGDYIAIGRAEVHVVAFEKCRPMRREHPFNATTNRPACSGPVGTANIKTSNGEVGTVLGPGGAALEVPQPGGSERIADAAGQGVKPTILEVNRACCTWQEKVLCLLRLDPSNISRMPSTHPP